MILAGDDGKACSWATGACSAIKGVNISHTKTSYSITSNPTQPKLSIISQRILVELYQSHNFQLGKPLWSRPGQARRRMCRWGFPYFFSYICPILGVLLQSQVENFCQNYFSSFCLICHSQSFLTVLKLVCSKGPALTWPNTPAAQTHHPVIVTFQDCQSKLCQYSSSPPQIF